MVLANTFRNKDSLDFISYEIFLKMFKSAFGSTDADEVWCVDTKKK